MQVNEEVICRGFLRKISKKPVSCTRRFCSECLQKNYADLWERRKRNPDTWHCPVCEGVCRCYQCVRKREKDLQSEDQDEAAHEEQFTKISSQNSAKLETKRVEAV